MTLLISGWVAIDELETPFGKAEGALGGPASYAAIAASLFTDVRLLAGVGEDFPPAFRASLARPNIDLAGLTTLPGKTSRWGARYHYDMNTRDVLYTDVNVNAQWQPTLPPGWEDSQSLFLAAAHPAVQMQIASMLPGLRTSLVDTIRYFIELVPDEVKQAMAGATFATVNEGEARELAGTPSIANAGRKLLANGGRGVIVKLGEYGAAFVSHDDYFVAPGYPLEEIVDPTGAGDTFGGGFMGYLDTVHEVNVREIRRAMIYGSTVASFAVEGFGPERLVRLTRADVEQRYRQFRALTHFEVDE
ncbi:MAG: PfkB family carbohydrate kinase [Dehalococcoidia bacterium]